MNLATHTPHYCTTPIDPATTIEALASITPPSVMSDVFPLLPQETSPPLRTRHFSDTASTGFPRDASSTLSRATLIGAFRFLG
ncbi:MAG: hypothetical protein R2857_15015 [Vampirovibrionales bacterium]